MVGVALIAIAVVFVVAYSSHRHRGAAASSPEESRPIDPRVARWVEAGLLSEAQAAAIADFERAALESRPPPRLSPAIEALAYVGGVLVAVGAGMLVGQSWDELGTAGHLVVTGLAALLTGGVGAMVGEADPVAWRLRGFLWALSAGALAALAGLVAFELGDLEGEPVALSVAVVGAAASFGYWQLRDRPLQHLLTFVGLSVSLGVAVTWAVGAESGLATGLALWLLGVGWAGLAWQRRIPPATLGFLSGVVLTLVSASIVGSQVEWLAPLLGLATACAWVGIGIATDEPVAMAPGVVGIFVFLPWTLGYFVGESVGAPVIAMVSGALLLGVVVLLMRRRRDRDGRRGGHLSHHLGAAAPR